MNTKQIWHALNTNSVTEPYFDGVFSLDLLDDIVVKPKLIICNTDPSYKKGSHWVLFYFDNGTVEFYDSLGKSINDYNSAFVNFGKTYAFDYVESAFKTQSKNTSICGELCLFYAYFRCKGYSMDYILNKMQSVNVVTFVYKNFDICNDSNCKLLQYSSLL